MAKSKLKRNIEHAISDAVESGHPRNGLVLMMSPNAYDELGAGKSFRGVRIEHHDEWSWGWMLRHPDGSFWEGKPNNVEPADDRG